MLVTTEGIVLKQRKIANNRRLIVLFSKDYGKITAGTSINERGKGKAALALRPFTYAEYDVFKTRDSYNINSASVIRSYYSVGEDIDRFIAASKLIEYIDSILLEGEARPKLFNLAIETLECISKADGNFNTLLYAYIVKSLRFQGVMPEVGCCVNCSKDIQDVRSESDGRPMFSINAGGVICNECEMREKTQGQSLIYKPSFDIVDIINYFEAKPISNFVRVSLKPEFERELQSILAEYISHYLGSNVLKEDVNLQI